MFGAVHVITVCTITDGCGNITHSKTINEWMHGMDPTQKAMLLDHLAAQKHFSIKGKMRLFDPNVHLGSEAEGCEESSSTNGQ